MNFFCLGGHTILGGDLIRGIAPAAVVFEAARFPMFGQLLRARPLTRRR